MRHETIELIMTNVKVLLEQYNMTKKELSRRADNILPGYFRVSILNRAGDGKLQDVLTITQNLRYKGIDYYRDRTLVRHSSKQYDLKRSAIELERYEYDIKEVNQSNIVSMRLRCIEECKELECRLNELREYKNALDAKLKEL